MKTTTQKRLALLAGLLLLSLLVFATGVQAAQAAADVSPLAGTQGRGGLDLTAVAVASDVSPLAGTQGRGGLDLQGAGLSATGVSPLAGTQGRGGLDLRGTSQSATEVSPLAGTQGRGGLDLAAVAAASGVQPASSDTSSSTGWMFAGSAAVILFVGFLAWALIRRRRQPGERASAYCAQHPEDPLCATA
jgi:hypothetical protein